MKTMTCIFFLLPMLMDCLRYKKNHSDKKSTFNAHSFPPSLKHTHFLFHAFCLSLSFILFLSLFLSLFLFLISPSITTLAYLFLLLNLLDVRLKYKQFYLPGLKLISQWLLFCYLLQLSGLESLTHIVLT